MIDSSSKPGNLSCIEVREMLSDVIDVRRAELPHPDGTRLAEPGIRPAIELHLVACQDCRDELAMLEDIGCAYTEYSVNEPPAQYFADYGARARARMNPAKNTVVAMPGRRWLTFGISGLAAASIAIAAMRLPGHWNSGKEEPQAAVAEKHSQPQIPAPTPRFRETPPPIAALLPANTGSTTPDYLNLSDPADPAALDSTVVDRLARNEHSYGYMVVGERIPRGERPLLGVFLRTTRDQDRNVDEGSPGLAVYDVLPGSPAEAMGLRKNDYIVDINGISTVDGGVKDMAGFFGEVIKLGGRKTVSIHIIRSENGQYIYKRPLQGALGQYSE